MNADGQAHYFQDTRVEIPELRRTPQIVKRLFVKIFTDHNRMAKRVTLQRPGQAFTRELVLFNLGRIALQLEQQAPLHIYKIIEVGKGEFNFVWQGLRCENWTDDHILIHPGGVIYEEDEPPGYYWFDETQADYYGPCETAEIARAERTKYAETYLETKEEPLCLAGTVEPASKAENEPGTM